MQKTDIGKQSGVSANLCFGCGDANPNGLRLRFLADEGGTVVCRTKVARRFQGPPGCVHGGVIATLLDEAMSKSTRTQGVTAMTRHIEVNYLRPVPLQTEVEITGRLVRVDGRKHFCEAEIRVEGKLLATGRALFMAVQRG